MNRKHLTKVGVTLIGIIASLYVIFLILPLILNPIINGYIPQFKNIIHETYGLDSEISEISIVTTPKLTAGLKIKNFKLLEKNNAEILSSNNFQIKMSLLPLLMKRIEIDAIQIKDVKAEIVFNSDGSLEIEKYISDNSPKQENSLSALPFGFKLSNHLPNITIASYQITLTNGIDRYILSGKDSEISDFILGKSVKIKTIGDLKLKGRKQFNYDIKILNKIMPQMDLNEIVFNPAPQNLKEENYSIDIIGILERIYVHKLTADIKTNLKIEEDKINGYSEITNLSIINLPTSFIKLKFNGNKIDIQSNIYTAKNEISNINGIIKTGKKPNIDINFKSQVEIANILRIVKEIAIIFDIKDLQTLSANGKLDANFNIKSDLKRLKSNGYLKIPTADLYYGLYKVGIDGINADITLDNNNVNIKNIGFSILGQPLKLYGTITNDALCNVFLSAENLSLKGLMVAMGQASLMKENKVNSGTISVNADIKGNLDKINPIAKISLSNINIKNIPSNTSVIAPNTSINLTSDGKTFSGNAQSINIKINNPCAKISIPVINALIKENEIEITQTPVSIEKINLNIAGKIKNYLTEKISLDFKTTGDIKSTFSGDINPIKQILNLNYTTDEASTIIIPMFNKSKMTFNTNLDINGSFINPQVNGNINIPLLNIPEIPVEMTNLNIKLHGNILNGNGNLEKFKSGGIEAENLTSTFSLKGNNFYLNNLQGSAFDGKINGNIIYNLANGKTNIIFAGNGLNAEKAVYGGIGIKSAIYGTLDFNTTISLLVADYNEMMKSLKGNLNFNVKNGTFGAIGKLDSLLQANNIITNSILKTTVNTIANNLVLTDTAKFDYIDGKLNFRNGWAEINPIKSSGQSLAYYVTGKYNLINNTTNLEILGRLDSKVVAKLGPLGQLSADKLLSYIPKFGTATAKIAEALTTNPKTENISAIPALTGDSTASKDFKVIFNGGLESKNSVKSFKWLTDIDTSAIETKTLKETVNDIKTSVGEDYKNTVDSIKSVVTNSKEQLNNAKEDWNNTKNQFKNSAEDIINLFKKKDSVNQTSTEN